MAELARLLHQLNRGVEVGSSGRTGPHQLHVHRRRVVVRLAAPAGRPRPRPPAPAPAPARTSACAPSLRTKARQSVQSPSRNISTQRLAPSVSAASARTSARGDGSRHRAGRHRRVGGRREEAALPVADGRVGDRGRGQEAAGQPGEPVVQYGRHRAVRAIRAAGPSRTAPGTPRPSATSGPGPPSPAAYVGEKGHRFAAWASAVREMACESTSGSGISRRETDSSVRAPPRRAVNQGTECRQPSPSGGGVTPSRTTSAPPCPEAGRADRREVLVGAVGVAGLRDEFGAHPASLHEPFTSSAKGRQRSPYDPDPPGRAPGLAWNDREPVKRGGEYCQSPSPTSNRPDVRDVGTTPEELVRQLPVRCSLLRVAGLMMRAHCPPALGGSEAVPGVRPIS